MKQRQYYTAAALSFYRNEVVVLTLQTQNYIPHHALTRVF